MLRIFFSETVKELSPELAKQISNPPLRKALASSYYDQSLDLNSANRHEEALKAAQESINIREGLRYTDPSLWEPLAQSHDSLGIAAQALGRYEEAVNATQEAVTIRKELITISVPRTQS